MDVAMTVRAWAVGAWLDGDIPLSRHLCIAAMSISIQVGVHRPARIAAMFIPCKKNLRTNGKEEQTGGNTERTEKGDGRKEQRRGNGNERIGKENGIKNRHCPHH